MYIYNIYDIYIYNIMQSSSKEESTLVADRVLKCKQTDAAAVAT